MVRALVKAKTSAPKDTYSAEGARRLTIRQAAGVVNVIGLRTPEGRHFGRFVCVDCPREHHVPPYLPFGLESHKREHLERYTSHQIKFYCFDHCEFEESELGNVVTQLPESAPLALVPSPITQAVEGITSKSLEVIPPRVLVALEVLRRAGYSVAPVAALLPLPDPPLLFTHGEAAVLGLVREHPGILTREIAAQRGLVRGTVTAYLVGLHKGRHVRLEMGRWYPVGDRPIGKVTAREKVRWVRRHAPIYQH